MQTAQRVDLALDYLFSVAAVAAVGDDALPSPLNRSIIRTDGLFKLAKSTLQLVKAFNALKAKLD